MSTVVEKLKNYLIPLRPYLKKNQKQKTPKLLFRIKNEKIDGINYTKIKLYYVAETTINNQKTDYQ